MATQRESSKKDWTSNDTVQDINSGCFQRIADACEKMASNYTRLQQDVESYKRWYKQECEQRQALERKLSAYKGAITKLKKQQKVQVSDTTEAK
jgi:hypothetical protein